MSYYVHIHRETKLFIGAYAITVCVTNRLLGAAANLEASLSCYLLLVGYSQIYILD